LLLRAASCRARLLLLDRQPAGRAAIDRYRLQAVGPTTANPQQQRANGTDS